MKCKILSEVLSENITDSALVWFDHALNMSIHVFNNSIYEPYFVIVNNTDITKANKCARLCILQNKYIIAKDKRNWYLDDSMKSILLNILNSKNSTDYTIWESIIYHFFVEKYRLFLRKDQLPKIEIPDYNSKTDRIVIGY